MPNSNNFYSSDPFGIFKVGNQSQSGGGFGNGPKSPVTKVIIVVFLLVGIAAVFIFQDVLKKFFFGETPKKKVSKPEEKENTEVEIKEKADPVTENTEEGTGATIIE